MTAINSIWDKTPWMTQSNWDSLEKPDQTVAVLKGINAVPELDVTWRLSEYEALPNELSEEVINLYEQEAVIGKLTGNSNSAN